MTTPSLFDVMAPAVAPTSLAQFERIRPSLPLRDLLMCLHVADYLQAKAAWGYTDVTGRELAAWLRRDVLSVRPRLTEACKAGWLATAKPRKSREPNEMVCAPYALAVPRAAVERAIREIEDAQKSARKTAKLVDFSGEVKSEGATVGGAKELVIPSPLADIAPEQGAQARQRFHRV